MMTNVLFILAIIIYLVINAVSTTRKYADTFHKVNENLDNETKEESK